MFGSLDGGMEFMPDPSQFREHPLDRLSIRGGGESLPVLAHMLVVERFQAWFFADTLDHEGERVLLLNFANGLQSQSEVHEVVGGAGPSDSNAVCSRLRLPLFGIDAVGNYDHI